MLICDQCNVIVTKPTYCSDKCRVAHHRSNASVTEGITSPPKKIKPLKIDPRPKSISAHRPFDICPKHKVYYQSCGD